MAMVLTSVMVVAVADVGVVLQTTFGVAVVIFWIAYFVSTAFSVAISGVTRFACVLVLVITTVIIPTALFICVLLGVAAVDCSVSRTFCHAIDIIHVPSRYINSAVGMFRVEVA